jgi:peptidoglycan/xylan/chitin deacetylase (PgdA/CDA1 family)
MSPSGKRVFLLGLTLVPPALLLASGWSLAALVVLVALHLLIVVSTLYPHSEWFGPVLTRLPTDRREVWLTIDDGPSTDTAAVLDLLDEFHARATFFLVSARASQQPELVAAIRRRGHDIGNHTATHPAARFWSLGPGRMEEEIGTAQQVLTSLSGQAPRWFRSVAVPIKACYPDDRRASHCRPARDLWRITRVVARKTFAGDRPQWTRDMLRAID